MTGVSLPVRYRSQVGSPLISVTQVLTLAERIDCTWFTPESALRGQTVHAMTEAFDRGESFDIPDDLIGYMDAYAEFVAVAQPVYEATEVRVTNELLGVGGRIDRVVASLFGSPGILDFKTGPPAPWHGQQLAAYNAMCPRGVRWGCYLQRNGRYKLKTYDDPQDHRRFMFDLAKVRGTVQPDGDHWIAL
jgi:hypothetical protein